MNKDPSKPDDYYHCFTPDTFEVYRQNGGAVAWMALAILVAVIVGLALFGCTYTRNAPLINVQDSANGNTVPLVGQ